MTYRAVLQVVEDVGGIAQPVFAVASCATCRWAAKEEGDDGPLVCYRIPANGEPHSAGPSLASLDVGDPFVDACLEVAPTFGCVQWEGK